MPVSIDILHLEHRLWNYNTIISVVIHIKAYEICDPCAHNTTCKKIILVAAVFIKSNLQTQTPTMPRTVELFTDNSDLATVTQLPISTTVWNR